MSDVVVADGDTWADLFFNPAPDLIGHHPVYGPVYGPVRDLPDGRLAYVQPLVFGRARICVGDEFSVHDGY